MPTASNQLNQITATRFSSRIASIAYTIAATLLAVNLREALDAASSGDKTDAAYTWGM